MKRFLAVVAVPLLFVGVVWAQAVDQGAPGKKGPWPVTLSGTGTSTVVTVTDQACTAAVESVIVFDGGGSTPCPITALTSRRTALLCNSPKNSGAPVWTVRADGVAPTTAATNPGQTLSVGDCINYSIAATGSDGGAPLNCISDTGNSVLTITECR